MAENRLTPPKSWKAPKTHYQQVLHSDWYKVISRIEDLFIRSTIRFYEERKFKFMMLPITTGTISSPMGLGSDSKPVRVNLEGIDTYLADSMQFFLEFACRINKEGTYYIAPSFRGELADSRHLCQFYHSEAEIIGDLGDVISLSTEYITYLVNDILHELKEDIIKIAGHTQHLEDWLLLNNQIPRCTFDEAVEILGNNKKFVEIKDGIRTINSSGEKELIRLFNSAVWLTHFDHISVPFYQAYDPGDKMKAKNADLLIGIGETVGAGERHLTGNNVREALKAHNVREDEYDWYINLKNDVTVQTSGFGLGIERFILWVINHDDIRDVQLLPRFNGEEIIF